VPLLAENIGLLLFLEVEVNVHIFFVLAHLLRRGGFIGDGLQSAPGLAGVLKNFDIVFIKQIS
jgi:hypothetical protein